jgi:molybdate transport system substrate-binding protein
MKARLSAFVAAATLASGCSFGADITVVSTIGVRDVLERVRQHFEHSGANRLNVQYGLASAMKQRLDDGGTFDVAILTRPMIDDLVRQGKVVRATSATLGKTGIAIAVKAGAAKPDIGTHDALRHALLSSGGVAYRNEGPSEATAKRVFNALGITTRIQGEVYVDPRPAGGLLALEEGRAAIAFATMSEIAADSKVALVAPLPDDLQSYIVFAAGIAPGAKDKQACLSFIAFLRTAQVRRELRKVGMVVSR